MVTVEVDLSDIDEDVLIGYVVENYAKETGERLLSCKSVSLHIRIQDLRKELRQLEDQLLDKYLMYRVDHRNAIERGEL
tara:strand:- start:139 stop:375 length:237 start_codon:yes stop_codon:yes gene_type:complete